jgi:hypothetical protein
MEDEQKGPQGLQDRELQAHYEAMFDLYGTPGWARLQKQLGEIIDGFNSVAGIDTAEQLWFRKGQLDQALWLMGHQAAHEAAYNELLVADSEDAAAPASGGRGKVIE